MHPDLCVCVCVCVCVRVRERERERGGGGGEWIVHPDLCYLSDYITHTFHILWIKM